MSFFDLMSIREQSVGARLRLEKLLDAGIISSEDFCETCDRFSKTWVIVHDYMLENGYCSQ